MKLTRQMFIDGTIDVEELKIVDLKEFCEAEELDINCAARRGKTTILNEVVDLIESNEPDAIAELSANEPETLTESTKSEPLPEMDKIRPNGEVIRLAKDGKDYGANLINRTK